MKSSERTFRSDGEDVLVSIFAKPKANRSRVVGEKAGALEIQIAAPPSDGEANRELREFLAKKTRHPRSLVTLERGEKDRHKLVRFVRAEVAEIARSLLGEVADDGEEH